MVGVTAFGQSENQSASELLSSYFEEYLEGISHEDFWEGERARGLEERSWPFRRYVLERNDFGMEKFMRLNLSEGDYTVWCDLNKP